VQVSIETISKRVKFMVDFTKYLGRGQSPLPGCANAGSLQAGHEADDDDQSREQGER